MKKPLSERVRIMSELKRRQRNEERVIALIYLLVALALFTLVFQTGMRHQRDLYKKQGLDPHLSEVGK